MNVLLERLSKQFPNDVILLCSDGAAWHKSNILLAPDNMELFHLPPNTPELNPIEQIWEENHKIGFCNEVFATLEKVVNRLCDTICPLPHDVIFSIAARNWALRCFH